MLYFISCTKKLEATDNIKSNLYPAPTESGVKAFLSSSFIEGIGRVFADKIVDRLGTAAVQRILENPEILKEIPGLGESKAKSLVESLTRLKFPSALLEFLYSTGLSDIDIEKILGHLGKLTEKVVLNDPYQMVEDVWKLSFFTADKIGRYLHYAPDDPRRLRGALLTSVKLYAEKGNICATEDEAVELASRLTKVPEEKVRKEVKPLIEEGRLILSRNCLYLPVYYKAEKEGAEKIASLVRTADTASAPEIHAMYDREGNAFSKAQLEAISAVMSHPVTIITGGPGTGKTTAIRGIIELLQSQDKNVVLVAPTGRAAKRMTDMSGIEAKTIHRLLGYRRGEGYRNKKFDADILIIDEASMLEQVLFNHLLHALKPGTKIVIVGDVDQLPPIGAGDVLRDMIESGTVPVIRLSENFRQRQGSMIAFNANSIKEGLMPDNNNESDFEIFYESSVKKIKECVLNLVSVEIPRQYIIDPKNIQVVTPMQEGPLGAKILNEEIRDRVNPVGPSIRKGQKLFRLGDRVMQKSNSSQRHTYNGETGWISRIDELTESLEVTFFDGKVSRYSKRDFGELSLAYATTVHKLQGCEIDYMVMPLALSHGPLLYRNLLYTAVSRAKKLCVIVGDKKAVRLAVENENPIKRHTNFSLRLKENLSHITNIDNPKLTA